MVGAPRQRAVEVRVDVVLDALVEVSPIGGRSARVVPLIEQGHLDAGDLVQRFDPVV